MNRINLILLPGLDGTGRLFKPLLEIIPPRFTSFVISYPSDDCLDYDELLVYVRNRIPVDEPFVILAESFSSPIAVRIAATNPAHLTAMILCAGFVTSPNRLLSRWMKSLIGAPMFYIKPPDFLVRRLFLGKDAPIEVVKMFRETLPLVKPQVMASRLQSVLDVDVRDGLKQCRVPTLYLAAKRDALVSKQSLAEIKAIKPDIESTEIDGPHLLLQSKPDRTFKAIDEFLQRKIRFNLPEITL